MSLAVTEYVFNADSNMSNSHVSQDPTEHFKQEFCGDSAITPDQFEAAIEVIDDAPIDPHTKEPEGYPIHDRLNWRHPSRFWRTQPHRFGAGACFLQETGETWQIKPLNPRWDTEKNKPFKYETPKSKEGKDGSKQSTNKPFLPPIARSSFTAICRRHGLDPDTAWAEKERIGSFWGWLARQNEIPLAMTEGGKKGLSPICQGVVTIALQGIWNAVRKGKKDGEFELLPELEPFCTKGREIILAFDQDENPFKTALAERRLATVLLKRGCVVKSAKWDRQNGDCKGIDDLIAHAGPEAWDRALAEAEPQTLDPLPIPSWAAFGEVISRATHDKQADHITDLLKDVLAWDVVNKYWILYNQNPKFPGVWLKAETEFVHKAVESAIKQMDGEIPLIAESWEKGYRVGHNFREIAALTDLIQLRLLQIPQELDRDLLPFKNGILNTKTGVFTPGHKPENRLRWQLPYDYDPLATCDPIVNWLHEATSNDPAIVEVLRAFLRAVLLGRADLQRFLELVGPGGTGKSTLTRLMVALVGETNTKSTSLRELENGRFEGAELVGKRLILISDSDRYGGSVSQLKCITGGDPIRIERKYQQETGSALIDAMVVLTVNEAIQTSDYTSGLQRRRLVIPFTNQIDPANQRDLITVGYGKTSGEFAPFLPGLVNWVLQLSEERMQALVRNTSREVPSLEGYRIESILESNPMAQWVDNCLLFEPLSRERVGLSNESAYSSLYASYCEFIKNTGAHPVSANRFSTLFQDLLCKQLKKPVEKGRDRLGTFFKGIRIRMESDTADRSLTGPLDGPIPVLEAEPIAHQPIAPITPEPEPITATDEGQYDHSFFNPGDRVIFNTTNLNGQKLIGHGVIKAITPRTAHGGGLYIVHCTEEKDDPAYENLPLMSASDLQIVALSLA